MIGDAFDSDGGGLNRVDGRIGLETGTWSRFWTTGAGVATLVGLGEMG